MQIQCAFFCPRFFGQRRQFSHDDNVARLSETVKTHSPAARLFTLAEHLATYNSVCMDDASLQGKPFSNPFTGRNVRFACLQIYCKSCYKFQICNDLPHLHLILRLALNDIFDVDEFNYYLVRQKCHCCRIKRQISNKFISSISL